MSLVNVSLQLLLVSVHLSISAAAIGMHPLSSRFSVMGHVLSLFPPQAATRLSCSPSLAPCLCQVPSPLTAPKEEEETYIDGPSYSTRTSPATSTSHDIDVLETPQQLLAKRLAADAVMKQLLGILIPFFYEADTADKFMLSSCIERRQTLRHTTAPSYAVFSA